MIREYIIKISDEVMEDEFADRPQEIIRCRDCKNYDDVTTECADIGSPCYRNGWCGPDWFCADGQRRTDDA